MQAFVPSATMWTMPSTPVPEHVRQFIIASYGINPEADMYVNYDEPNKVYMIHNGFLQYVDFASPSLRSPTIISDLANNAVLNNQPVFTFEENVPAYDVNYASPGYGGAVMQSAPLKQPPVTAQSIDILQPSLESEVLYSKEVRSEQYTEVAKKAKRSSDKVNALQLASELPEVNSAEWHKLTDSERELIQRERRKANAFKTALCQSFKESGTCEYGSECRFAHGESELRLPPQAHPKYKTQLCNKFSVNGYCPYGSRCQFIHQRSNDNPTQKENQQNSKDNADCSKTSNLSDGKNGRSVNDSFDQRAVEDDITNFVLDKENIPTRVYTGMKAGKMKTVRVGSGVKSVSSWNKNSDTTCFAENQLTTQLTPQASRVSAVKGQTEIIPLQAKSSVAEIVEKLFLDDTDTAFSQSCFPKLSLSPNWYTTVKSK